MNGNSYLLDTNVIIAALNQRLVLPDAQYYVSVITEIELLSFPEITTDDEYQINRFLSEVNVVGLTPEIKETTIGLRRKRKVKLPDAIICASALNVHATLVTDDVQLHTVEIGKVIKLQDLLV